MTCVTGSERFLSAIGKIDFVKSPIFWYPDKMSLPIFDLEQAEKHPFIAYNASAEKLAESKEAWTKLSEITANNREAANTVYKKARLLFGFCEERLYHTQKDNSTRKENEEERLELLDMKDKTCLAFIRAAEIATWAGLQKDICDAFCEFKATKSDEEVEAAIASCKEPARWTISKMEERADFWRSKI